MAAIGHVHTSFSIHREVLASLPSTELVRPAGGDRGLRWVLETLRASGKQLFLVTNSPLWYIEPQLTHFVGADWRGFFEFTIGSARKPAWFADGRASAPLRAQLPDGTLSMCRTLPDPHPDRP